MQNEITLNDESFEYAAYQKISPAVKTFLSDYLGEKLLHLEPESYSEIESTIQENIFCYACVIPDILYNHRTIKDEDEWDNAFDNFKLPSTEIAWPITKHWFDREFGTGDNEDTFLEDAYDFELNEAQQQAKKIVEKADIVTNDAQNFALFMRAGHQALNTAARQFLKDFALFDLTILSEVGFKEIQEKIDTMNEMILEDLFEIIQD